MSVRSELAGIFNFALLLSILRFTFSIYTDAHYGYDIDRNH